MFPVRELEIRVAVLPWHISIGPAGVITGVAGFSFTTTETGRELMLHASFATVMLDVV